MKSEGKASYYKFLGRANIWDALI